MLRSLYRNSLQPLQEREHFCSHCSFMSRVWKSSWLTIPTGCNNLKLQNHAYPQGTLRKSVLLNAPVTYRDSFIYIFSEIKFLRCRRGAERLAQTEEKPKAATLQTKQKRPSMSFNIMYFFLSFFLFHDCNIRTAYMLFVTSDF